MTMMFFATMAQLDAAMFGALQRREAETEEQPVAEAGSAQDRADQETGGGATRVAASCAAAMGAGWRRRA